MEFLFGKNIRHVQANNSFHMLTRRMEAIRFPGKLKTAEAVWSTLQHNWSFMKEKSRQIAALPPTFPHLFKSPLLHFVLLHFSKKIASNSFESADICEILRIKCIVTDSSLFSLSLESHLPPIPRPLPSTLYTPIFIFSLPCVLGLFVCPHLPDPPLFSLLLPPTWMTYLEHIAFATTTTSLTFEFDATLPNS